MEQTNRRGHLAALLTIFIWGTTFISTKLLLQDFQPIEILFFRFVLGFLALLLIYPRPMPKTTKAQELIFALAGLCGICLYYLLENIALTYTMASNVGVIISVAPCFTAILSGLFLRQQEKPQVRFFVGFAIAMLGICMISFNGTKLALNPLGDFLAVLAALVWACYSILTRKISSYGFSTIQTTRRVFAYGLVFMLPALYMFHFQWQWSRMVNPINAGNLLFLGLGASALCFVTWNYAVKVLGAVKTSIYIYLVPVITVVTSAIVLQEPISLLMLAGTLLTCVGLVVSEQK